ncbi:MAG: sigma 54-interacting transcriptional regulator [Saprospiraceae bacterium]|nr:sigma 54-interacting transcriptional regulator [Saprospiraceae bacterium]
MQNLKHEKIKNLGQLKESGYEPRSVKEEIRQNLKAALEGGQNVFEPILGYDTTVIPDIQRALLSQHNILLLGLRGQAKTRIARLMVQLMDEFIPIVRGSEINDDPLAPISKAARTQIAELGDDTPVDWIHRDERYVEKLATPDVTVADLIGDIDPIKAANLKLAYSDERVMHFGLIPRAHRGIFVINELPDLQPRIQVALFNILQEGDLQIRGFHIRLPLDIEFVFTANPEDYTNRGSIITPLKDRIESQILTHYPEDPVVGMAITEQEASISEDQKSIHISPLIKVIIQNIVEIARSSEFTDVKSGVSARLGISALENLVSTVERRMLINKEKKGSARLTDLWGVIPSITGKVELVYEGEEEGPESVALSFIQEAIEVAFEGYFKDPEKVKSDENDPYGVIRAYFQGGNTVDLTNDMKQSDYEQILNKVKGLDKLIESANIEKEDQSLFKELILNGLASKQVLNRNVIDNKVSYEDPLANMWEDLN